MSENVSRAQKELLKLVKWVLQLSDNTATRAGGQGAIWTNGLCAEDRLLRLEHAGFTDERGFFGSLHIC
jgi:hypothetical protein